MKIKKFFKSFLVIKFFRYYYGLLRFKLLRKFYGIKKLEEKKGIIDGTVEYNMTAYDHVSVDFNMERTSWLIYLLLSLEQINKDSKILIIGPRTENEILHLEGYGFKNITAVDLMSYSPKVILQDMHSLNLKDNSYDAVITGWTLSYSNNPKLVIDNIVNVLKNNSILIIGIQYMKDFEINKDKYNPKNRINTINQIKELLGKNLKKIIFQNEAPLKDLKDYEIKKRTGLSATNTIGCFEIQKK